MFSSTCIFSSLRRRRIYETWKHRLPFCSSLATAGADAGRFRGLFINRAHTLPVVSMPSQCAQRSGAHAEIPGVPDPRRRLKRVCQREGWETGQTGRGMNDNDMTGRDLCTGLDHVTYTPPPGSRREEDKLIDGFHLSPLRVSLWFSAWSCCGRRGDQTRHVSSCVCSVRRTLGPPSRLVDHCAIMPRFCSLYRSAVMPIQPTNPRRVASNARNAEVTNISGENFELVPALPKPNHTPYCPQVTLTLQTGPRQRVVPQEQSP